MEAKKHKKAMVAHEKALEWQELFMLAVQNEMPDDEVVETAYRVAGKSTHTGFWVLRSCFLMGANDLLDMIGLLPQRTLYPRNGIQKLRECC